MGVGKDECGVGDREIEQSAHRVIICHQLGTKEIDLSSTSLQGCPVVGDAAAV